LEDLSPLTGLPLTQLILTYTNVSDLKPLRGMPLQSLDCGVTRVTDLSPLKGMQLILFKCGWTNVSDLSPLQGMPLQMIWCDTYKISDLSALEGMPLRSVLFKLANVTRGLSVLRQMKSLDTIYYDAGKGLPAEEFWKKYDAGDFGQPLIGYNSPAFEQWMKDAASKPAEQQIEAVSKKLIELNPDFDGKVTPTIENDIVTGFEIVTDNVTNIAPIRALAGLKALRCDGTVSPTGEVRGKLVDLSPLKGMQIETFSFPYTAVSDLSPLRGMPLTVLNCAGTSVSDISALKGLPLRHLQVDVTQVRDLSLIREMPVKVLGINGKTSVVDLLALKGSLLEELWMIDSDVTDLSPLKDVPLKHIHLDFLPSRDIEQLRAIKKLETINRVPVETFWKDVESQQSAFQQWMKEVAAMPADQQVDAVTRKMRELNPGFDGVVAGNIVDEVVDGVTFLTDNVTDISPIQAFPKLNAVSCRGSQPRKGKLRDLSPLKGRPLRYLSAGCNLIKDLRPLTGMPLEQLYLDRTNVNDLSSINGMPLTHLWIQGTAVTDLAPLKGMPLTEIQLDFKRDRDTELLRSLSTLSTIDDKSAEVFWKEVDHD
jgi:Leucine-rich repeat (LRR) protein